MILGFRREHLLVAGWLLLVVALYLLQQEFLFWLFGASHFVTCDFGAYFAGQSAADANERNTQRTNMLNAAMWRQSRGSKGSALLPLYLRNPDGSQWEQTLGEDLMRGYNAGNALSPEEQMQNYIDVTASVKPMADAARGRAGEIFDGGITKRLTDSAAPTQAARLEIAPLRKQAAKEALDKTLSAIDAAQSARGMAGSTGTASNRLKFDATRDANTSSADALGMARLDNATESQRIRDYGDVQLPLQNLQLPYTMARQGVDMFNLPQDAYLDNLARRMQPLNFLRIGGAAPFTYQPMPTVNPNSWMTGVGNGLQEGISTGLNSYNRNQQIDALNQQRYMQGYQSTMGTPQYGGNTVAAQNALMNGPQYQQPAMSYGGGYTPPAATGGYPSGVSYDAPAYQDVTSIGY